MALKKVGIFTQLAAMVLRSPLSSSETQEKHGPIRHKREIVHLTTAHTAGKVERPMQKQTIQRENAAVITTLAWTCSARFER